ncbi:MAG: hypothetical protein A3C36_04020 [Omnitrophica WOR_2 bacterium RIFCSPHIGHO2_02_FULL_52_10]|nr:MAG: hypothetical protein A3C36_04020 [Omnitrophica WOR_2 bacterium RIFCSPHIGHO2_02_FULL_52_10]
MSINNPINREVYMRRITILLILLAIGFTGLQSAWAANLKKTVAVFEFQNDSGYASWVSMGHDFSDQLSDALVQSGKFIVLSRRDLDTVMAEQDLAASDRFAQSNTAKIGKIVPAQILVKGRVVDFQENTSSGGQGFSIKGVSLGTKRSSTSIGVIVQLIDSTTGEIIDSKRVDGEAKAGGLSVGFSGSFDLNSSDFKETPVGKATQIVIDRAVEYVASKMENIPWEGKVVTVKDNQVFVNAGTNAGVNVGDTFSVYNLGEALIDPDTGINLGSERTKIADIKVEEVQEKFSKAVTTGDITKIAKGDLVLK